MDTSWNETQAKVPQMGRGVFNTSVPNFLNQTAVSSQISQVCV